ncbi:MAG: type II CRISPR RNA-guided endonuclease Cas9, partial [Phycisphaeraceae bacterium JB051]
SDEEAAMQTLINQFGMTEKQADAAQRINFVDGYLHLSRKALEKLLPFMEQGMVYQAIDETNSAMHAAGYMRRDQLKRRLFDKLPRQDAFNCPLGDIPNPVVKRTLTELRRVINRIVKEYGLPDDIHLEMARSVSQGSQARKEASRFRSEREKMRDDAANEIRKLGFKATRTTITQYLLWQQQNHECIYTGQKISVSQLFSGEVDVDHILPKSQSLDDSQSNKVLCFRKANAAKRQRTVYQWLANTDKPQFDEICVRALSFVKNHGFPFGKYKKLMQKTVDVDSFISRQLNDTGYIAKATRQYLACLYDNDKHILGLKGQHTATLRRHWGLNNILRQDDLDLKTRDDHRHHAIDAIVVAATDRSRLQALSKGYQEEELIDFETGEVGFKQVHRGPKLDDPWDNFRDDVEKAVNPINVSYRVNRKVSGALHEDTVYAPVIQPDGHILPNTFVVRKPLLSLTANEIEKIRDKAIRQIVIKALADHGIEIGRKKTIDKKKFEEALKNLKMPSGVPIRKVRIFKEDQTIQPIRQVKADKADDPTRVAHVKPGSTHHLCLFEWEENGKTKRDAVFVTQLEAINRIKRQRQFVNEQIAQCKDIPTQKQARKKRYSQLYEQAATRFPLIDRKHPTRQNARFVMSLSSGEMVLRKMDGQEQLLVYNSAASTTQQMLFYNHTDARPKSGPKESAKKKISAKPNTLNARKVTVDPLGNIRWAND